MVQPGRLHMRIWNMRTACWIPTAATTHSGCVTLIVFPLQQCLHKRASFLRYKDVSCLSFNNSVTSRQITVYMILYCTFSVAVSGVSCCYDAMKHEQVNLYWSSRNIGFSKSALTLQVQVVVWLIRKGPFNSHAVYIHIVTVMLL